LSINCPGRQPGLECTAAAGTAGGPAEEQRPGTPFPKKEANMPSKKRTEADIAAVQEQLRTSPVRNLPAPDYMTVDMAQIDDDPTNPGADETSGRYDRRAESISDSFDILGGPVLPIVLCRNPEAPNRFLNIDGHGRRGEALRRNQPTIKALVFPPLTLEQRVCLRQILNGAQEPFDPPLILKDLQLLAKLRKLDIRKEADLRALLGDMPYNVRKHYTKLRLLSRWPESVADKIGIDDDDELGILGFEKVKELDGLVTALKRSHPSIAAKYPGDGAYKQMLDLYHSGYFRDGGRSQEAIREGRKLLKKLPKDHALADGLASGSIAFGEFREAAASQLQAGHGHLVSLCKNISVLLTDLDPATLTAPEIRSIERTADLMGKVLAEIGVTAR
jgi:hypothetical protein